MKTKYAFFVLALFLCKQLLPVTVQQSCINRYSNEIKKLEHTAAYEKLLYNFSSALESGTLDLENQSLTDYDTENLFALIVYTNWIYSYFTSPYGLKVVKIKGNRISNDMINKLLKTLHNTTIHDTCNNTYLEM